MTDPEPEPSFLSKKIYEAMCSESGSSNADVTLVSSDGVRIPAVRTLLAISSSYFQKLVTSEFAEKNLSEISVSIVSTSLHDILEFIYTDDCRLIRQLCGHEKGSRTLVSLCNPMRWLVALGGAADYTQMERLLSRCEGTLTSLMKRHPHLASVVLQETSGPGSAWGRKMFKLAKVQVLSTSRNALLTYFDGCDVKCGVMHLDERNAENLFTLTKEKRDCTHFKQRDMFQALVAWASGGTALRRGKRSSPGESPTIIDVGSMKLMDQRLETARRIAMWFNLTSFKPKFLSDVVEPSGLVEPAAVHMAYKKLSLQYEEIETVVGEEIASWEEQIRSAAAVLQNMSRSVRLRDIR